MGGTRGLRKVLGNLQKNNSKSGPKQGWKDSLEGKSDYGSCRISEFSPQHPHGGSESPVTLVPEILMSSSDLFSDAHGIHKNTHIHKVKNLKAKMKHHGRGSSSMPLLKLHNVRGLPSDF